jgi:hypothetical protein
VALAIVIPVLIAADIIGTVKNRARFTPLTFAIIIISIPGRTTGCGAGRPAEAQRDEFSITFVN